MKRKSETGFTLLEIVVVVVIVGIMVALAMPGFDSWLPDMHLRSAARELYSNMQKTRILAVKTNKSTAIIIDGGNNRYEICEDWSSADTSGTVATCGGPVVDFSSYGGDIKYGHGNATVQANSAATPFPLTPDDDVSYSSPDNVAVFNPRGVGNAGYIYLDHRDNTTSFAVGSLSSGIIKILRWKGGGWE